MSRPLKPEESLQLTIADYLRVSCPSILWWASGNGFYLGRSKSKIAYIVKMKKMGLLPGVLDLCLLWKDESGKPCVAFIELKAGKNKPTDEQKNMINNLHSLGFMADWTNSFEGFIALLVKFGAPHRQGFRYKERLISDSYPATSIRAIKDSLIKKERHE